MISTKTAFRWSDSNYSIIMVDGLRSGLLPYGDGGDGGWLGAGDWGGGQRVILK